MQLIKHHEIQQEQKNIQQYSILLSYRFKYHSLLVVVIIIVGLVAMVVFM